MSPIPSTTTQTLTSQGPTLQRLYANLCKSCIQITIHPVAANAQKHNLANRLITQMIPHYMERYHMTPHGARAAAEREVARQYPANKWDAEGPNPIFESPGETEKDKRAKEDEFFAKYLEQRGKRVVDCPVIDCSELLSVPSIVSTLSESLTNSAAASPPQTPTDLLDDDDDDDFVSWTPLTPSSPSLSLAQSEPAGLGAVRSCFDDWSSEMGEDEEDEDKDEEELVWCRFPAARMDMFGEELDLEWCRSPGARMDMFGDAWW